MTDAELIRTLQQAADHCDNIALEFLLRDTIARLKELTGVEL